MSLTAPTRRVVLSSCLMLAAMRKTRSAENDGFLDLRYAAGRLFWPSGSTPAACGVGGVRPDKREGDGASPAGTFPLLRAFYRADRIAPPHTALPLVALRPHDGWVDDPADPQYNRLVSLPYAASHEMMWREDGLYD